MAGESYALMSLQFLNGTKNGIKVNGILHNSRQKCDSIIQHPIKHEQISYLMSATLGRGIHALLKMLVF